MIGLSTALELARYGATLSGARRGRRRAGPRPGAAAGTPRAVTLKLSPQRCAPSSSTASHRIPSISSSIAGASSRCRSRFRFRADRRCRAIGQTPTAASAPIGMPLTPSTTSASARAGSCCSPRGGARIYERDSAIDNRAARSTRCVVLCRAASDGVSHIELDGPGHAGIELSATAATVRSSRGNGARVKCCGAIVLAAGTCSRRSIDGPAARRCQSHRSRARCSRSRLRTSGSRHHDGTTIYLPCRASAKSRSAQRPEHAGFDTSGVIPDAIEGMRRSAMRNLVPRLARRRRSLRIVGELSDPRHQTCSRSSAPIPKHDPRLIYACGHSQRMASSLAPSNSDAAVAALTQNRTRQTGAESILTASPEYAVTGERLSVVANYNCQTVGCRL